MIEPWIGKKIQTTLNESNKDFIVEIGKIRISIFRSELELKNITISSKIKQQGIPELNGEIESIKIEGINLTKAIFKKEFEIKDVTFFNISIKGQISLHKKEKQAKVSPYKVRIDSLFFDKTNLDIRDVLTAQRYSVKNGVLKVFDIQVEKLDTLNSRVVKRFDFNAQEFLTVSSDSMYTKTAIGINYSANSSTLLIDSISVHPNYPDYEFTKRHKFAIDRFEAGFNHITVCNFSMPDYFKSASLISSYIEIGKLNMKVFRDNRKPFKHVNKPAFQDMIYNYHGAINIDSIGLIKGNITYTEHNKKANEAGQISINEISAKIFKITNDSIYKTESGFLKLKADGLLMGKGKLTVLLKGRIFDPKNTFSLNGTLAGMEISELNPILEKNAFVFVTSGKIDAMNFSFTANNTKASGKMTFLYHGLDVAIKNKRTDDTTAIKERFMSIIANKILMNSNPVPGDGVRVGIIDYERDPEKFLINYCFKSALTGIKSSLVKKQK
jgi:hypothetical protein